MNGADAKPKHYRATTYLSWIEDEALITHLQNSDNEAGTLRHLARTGFQATDVPLKNADIQILPAQIQDTLNQILTNSSPDLIRQTITAAVTEALSHLEITPVSNVPDPQSEAEPDETNLDALLL